MPIRKKFEIYDGSPTSVEKRLRGHQRTQIGSVAYYSDESFSPNVVVIAYDEEVGDFPVPSRYEFKEWSLEEWDEESENNEYYDDTIIQHGPAFYHLDAREGVRVFTLSQHFSFPDYSEWELPTATITGNTNGGTAKITGLGGWPEENITVVLGNGDDANLIIFTGTKTQILGQTFQLSDETVFQNYFSGQISVSGVSAQWYSIGDEEYPQVLDSGEFEVYVDYERPEEEGDS